MPSLYVHLRAELEDFHPEAGGLWSGTNLETLGFAISVLERLCSHCFP